MKNIIAICGSTRTNSTNLNFIKAVAALSSEFFSVKIFNGIADIPHFNPDLDNDDPPSSVTTFRELLQNADGILICTPEYAMGVPGTLKNAIDWTVSSCEFSHKPVALITASSVGQKGHAALLETLKIIEAKMSDETQLLISFAKTKINNDCTVQDEATLAAIKKLITAFDVLIETNNSIKSKNKQ
ncbi:MAG TPA: NADPH-dependent FMN reductase [Chitinophagaceae bacterium]|nr:NADPH-dependent FMN reductase [Chitinophagaceae bacterium]